MTNSPRFSLISRSGHLQDFLQFLSRSLVENCREVSVAFNSFVCTTLAAKLPKWFRTTIDFSCRVRKFAVASRRIVLNWHRNKAKIQIFKLEYFVVEMWLI
jgi:hypothetical protein